MDQLNASLAKVEVRKEQSTVMDTSVDLRPEQVNIDQEIIKGETKNTTLEGACLY